ncbi:MAG: threonine synthase [Ruminococcaceae bacterium]|nr:threonine synthase [Oscillospiraceae bacterium]
MQYHSTRDNAVCVTAARAITQGISKDGGLFVPESFPPLSAQEIDSLVNCSYVERATYVLSKYLTDFTQEEVKACAEAAYSLERFRDPAIAPLRTLHDNTHILELWHGPTCAFKDMALQILPHLMRVSAEKTSDGKEIVILVATSGDTGKAALEGFRDAPHTRILVFYPEDGVSPMQKLQMVTQEGENVSVCAIRGNFDDAQTGVKTIFTDPAVADMLAQNGMMFSSANSINWGRLVPQIVYYVSAYCDLLKNGTLKNGEPMNVVVPTGNFGNILAAYYAKKMGLPIAKLICASNKNRVLTDFINSGTYDRNRAFFTTTSPSMDILISSNLERLLYELSGRDDAEIREWMSALSKDGSYTVSDTVKAAIEESFVGGCCDDEQTAATIRNIFETYGYLCDTHTAVAVHVCEEYLRDTGDTTPTVIASTANPYKFSSSVLTALGADVSALDEFEKVEALNTATGEAVPSPLSCLRGRTPRFTGVCDKENMQQVVYDLLGIQ